MAASSAEYVLKLPDDTSATSMVLGVSFSNGVLKSDYYSKVRTNVYQLKSPSTKTNGKRKLVVRTEDMDYIGNYDLNGKDSAYNYFIGVGDDSTGEMQLLPFKRVRTRPAISCLNDESDEEETTQQDNIPGIGKQDLLTMAFGGAKLKRNMESRLKHGIGTKMIHDALDSASMQSIAANASPSTDLTSSAASVLPEHFPNADTPRDAYPLEKFFPRKLQEDIRPYIDDIMMLSVAAEYTEDQIDTYSRAVLEHLMRMPLGKSEREGVAVTLKFLQLLIRLWKKIGKQVCPVITQAHLKEVMNFKIPQTCLKYIKDEFLVNKTKYSWEVPKRFKDKLLVRIILLSLHVGEFDINAERLLQDLQFPTDRVGKVVAAMGCKFKIDKKDNVPVSRILLKVPLSFPKLGGKKTKRR